MKKLFKVLGLGFMFLVYLGIVAPLADAWCVYNYTDIPLRIWSGPGNTDPKFYVDNGNFNCCTKRNHSKCTGPTYVTFAQAHTPWEEPFYYVPVQVPTHGVVIIKGHKMVGVMTYEVYDADMKLLGQGFVKGSIDAPYEP